MRLHRASTRLASFALVIGLAAGLQPASTSAAEKPAQKWAILIGVDDYSDLTKLGDCGGDLQEVRDRLVALGFAPDHVVFMHDTADDKQYRPTKGNIEAQLKRVLAGAGENDMVILAFAGHGVHLDSASYLCPTEANLTSPKETMIPLATILADLEKCSAKHKALIVDACRDDPRIEGRKDLPDPGAHKFLASFDHPPKGVVTIVSCSPGESSREDGKIGHALFLHFLAKGLGGEARDAKPSRGGAIWGGIQLQGAFDYARAKTSEYVSLRFNGVQTPQIHGENIESIVLSETIDEPMLPPEETNSIGAKLLLVHPGEFMMGSPPDEHGALGHHEDDEMLHRVRIARPFYISAHHVTQAEYEKVMGVNPSFFCKTGEGREKVAGIDTANFPVEQVSWNDAQEFCKRLGQKEGKNYHLATEAQWEYACRAGTTTAFNCGDKLTQADACFSLKFNDLQRPVPVGSYKPNAWGLYDMHGDIDEWCQDWYGGDYYKTGPLENPQGPPSGIFHSMRGGCWRDTAVRSRSADRHMAPPTLRFMLVGFRVVCEP